MRYNTTSIVVAFILISLLASCNGMSREEIESKISDSVTDMTSQFATKTELELVSTNANTVSNTVASLQTEVQGIKNKVLDMEEKFEAFRQVAARSSELNKLEQELRAAINAVKEELLIKVAELNSAMALLSTKDEVASMLGNYVKRADFDAEISSVKESLVAFNDQISKEISNITQELDSKANVADLALINKRIDEIIGDPRVNNLEKELQSLRSLIEEKDNIFRSSIEEITRNNSTISEEIISLRGKMEEIMTQISLIGDQKEELRILKERVDKILLDQTSTSNQPANDNPVQTETEPVNNQLPNQGNDTKPQQDDRINQTETLEASSGNNQSGLNQVNTASDQQVQDNAQTSTDVQETVTAP